MPSEWSKSEACLENSLGMSKARTRRSRGIPTKGGITTNFYVFGNAAKSLQEALFGCNK